MFGCTPSTGAQGVIDDTAFEEVTGGVEAQVVSYHVAFRFHFGQDSNGAVSRDMCVLL